MPYLSKRLVQLILFVSIVVIATASSAKKEKTPDAYLDVNAQQVLIGIGYGWGKGVVKFQGQRHAIKLGGFQLVGVGYTSSDITGNVYNLTNIADIEGTYAVGGVGGTLVKGASAVTMKNGKGVVIDMWTTKKGLDFSLGGGGLKIQLLKE